MSFIFFPPIFRALAEIILPVLQQTGTKRNRDMANRPDNSATQEKQWIKRLLKRIHSPQVLSMLCAFLVTYYNSINEDTSLEIQCELPLLPLTVNSSLNINEVIEVFLRLEASRGVYFSSNSVISFLPFVKIKNQRILLPNNLMKKLKKP